MEARALKHRVEEGVQFVEISVAAPVESVVHVELAFFCFTVRADDGGILKSRVAKEPVKRFDGNRRHELLFERFPATRVDVQLRAGAR